MITPEISIVLSMTQLTAPEISFGTIGVSAPLSFLGFGGAGAGARALGAKISKGTSWLSVYTIADTLVLVSPEVTFTIFSVVITLRAKRLPDPASVVIGTPDLIMAEKAPSVGAKMVTPSLESLSWENTWMSS
ncbi:hypothetical protein NC653_028757 [Populus alba x Populus x berolinensis]|uniref:Uncharacterized protein n=1 Tax=Populus alba x Populus x berolinensis TaxID=444605 RepID=A0AAD6Q2E4_9ROSI|nr:hypothetical protein NC653_028757 [Populus alba x Populus x berolinensis]